MIAICQGPIQSVAQVWDTQGTLPVNDTSETYRLAVPATIMRKLTNYNTFISDLGVNLKGQP